MHLDEIPDFDQAGGDRQSSEHDWAMYAKIIATECHLIELQNTQHQHYCSINWRLGLLELNTRQTALQPAKCVASHGREQQKDREEQKERGERVMRERQLILQLSPSAPMTCMFYGMSMSLELVGEKQQRISLLVKEVR
eukprot:1629278-Ditylum_brightwellii.AAC.1